MNKKGQMGDIIVSIFIFSFISMIGITFGVIMWGVTNDYMIYEMQEEVNSLNADGVISDAMRDHTEGIGEGFIEFIDIFDIVWLLSYIVFFLSTLVLAYYSQQEGFFSFISYLLYGTMVFLFILTIFTTLSDWWQTEILYNLMPTLQDSMSYFDYYLDHVALFSVIQLVICLLINQIDLGIDRIIGKKDVADNSNEVV